MWLKMSFFFFCYNKAWRGPTNPSLILWTQKQDRPNCSSSMFIHSYFRSRNWALLTLLIRSAKCSRQKQPRRRVRVVEQERQIIKHIMFITYVKHRAWMGNRRSKGIRVNPGPEEKQIQATWHPFIVYFLILCSEMGIALKCFRGLSWFELQNYVILACRYVPIVLALEGGR